MRVGGPDIQQYSSLNACSTVDLAIVVTTSDFTPDARELADELGVKLTNGREFAAFVNELGRADLVADHAGLDLRARDEREQDEDADESGIVSRLFNWG